VLHLHASDAPPMPGSGGASLRQRKPDNARDLRLVTGQRPVATLVSKRTRPGAAPPRGKKKDHARDP